MYLKYKYLFYKLMWISHIGNTSTEYIRSYASKKSCDFTLCDWSTIRPVSDQYKQLMALTAVLLIKHTSTYLFFWQFNVITWVIKFNYFHNLNLWFCCFDHSHAEQSCASHVTVSLFFTRLVLVSGLHLWESYVGLMPSIALLPAHSCSPSTIHSPALLTDCFLHLCSAITIHDLHTHTRHRGCKSTGGSLLLDISWEKWLNVWNG